MARRRPARARATPQEKSRILDRAPVPTATAEYVVWAVDVQFDSTTEGLPIKIPYVADEHTREALGGSVNVRSPPMCWLRSSTTSPEHVAQPRAPKALP